MTSPTFTLPLEEWIKSIRAEWRRHEPFIAGALSHHAQEELALAAIAVLAPMIAEEAAKVASRYSMDPKAATVHPDIPFGEMSETAQLIVFDTRLLSEIEIHTTAQGIAAAIRAKFGVWQ